MTSETKRKINLGSWDITQSFVDEYLKSVGDLSPIYKEANTAPPTALAAQVLSLLLEKLRLPPGTVHASQEMTAESMIRISQRVHGFAYVSRPRRRREWDLITADFAVCISNGTPLLKGRTTVMTPIEETN